MKKRLVFMLVLLLFASRNGYAGCESDYNWARSGYKTGLDHFNQAAGYARDSFEVDADTDSVPYLKNAILLYSRAIKAFEAAIEGFQEVYDYCDDGIDDAAWERMENLEKDIAEAQKRIKRHQRALKGYDYFDIALNTFRQAKDSFLESLDYTSSGYSPKAMDIAPLKRGVQLLKIAKQDYIKSASSYRNAREHLGHRYKNPGTLWQYQIEEAQQEASMMDGYINDIEKRINELTNELNSEVHLITQAKHGLDMPFIRVEGGCYQMGSSDTTPGHKVCVDGFWIGKYEVTQAQWTAVMNNHPSSRHNCKACPVEQVSWNDVQTFIKLLNSKTGKSFRLPTEAEWEYAARSGGKEQIYAGSNTPDDFAWYRENSAAAIHSIKKLPNGLGIYNMSGNAWEWCLDFYNENYYQTSPLNNPQGPETGKNRVIRGGGYLSSENECRVTHRNNADPKERNGSLGFRLLLSSSPARPTGQAQAKPPADCSSLLKTYNKWANKGRNHFNTARKLMEGTSHLDETALDKTTDTITQYESAMAAYRKGLSALSHINKACEDPQKVTEVKKVISQEMNQAKKDIDLLNLLHQKIKDYNAGSDLYQGALQLLDRTKDQMSDYTDNDAWTDEKENSVIAQLAKAYTDSEQSKAFFSAVNGASTLDAQHKGIQQLIRLGADQLSSIDRLMEEIHVWEQLLKNRVSGKGTVFKYSEDNGVSNTTGQPANHTNDQKIDPAQDITMAIKTDGQGKESQAVSNAAMPGRNIVLTSRQHGVDLELVWIEGNCFQMGSNSGEADEAPVHKVCVDGFWMATYEITNSQYRQFNPDHDSLSVLGADLNGADQPVVYVSWDDARQYILWLNQKTGFTFSLPTEAQWEYGARGGTKTVRFWGDNENDAAGYANVYDITSDNAFNLDNLQHHNCEDNYAATSPVGSFKPNNFGLYDMLGNVWELCADVYDETAYSKHDVNNPVINAGSRAYVMRGGGWQTTPSNVRAANRGHVVLGHKDGPSDWIGFRLVLNAP